MSKPFAIAKGDRIKITNENAKEIRRMYKDAAKYISGEISKSNVDSIPSSIYRLSYLNQLEQKIEDRIVEIDKYVENIIIKGMSDVSKSIVIDNAKMINDMGFNPRMGNSIAMSYIPQDVVHDIITGKLYEGRWSLSKAIWSDEEKKIKDIQTIIAQGVTIQKSTYEIAKDLEKYVNPSVRKDWQWSKVYPGTNKVVDYSAQRLARTMVSHAYEESFVRTTKNNPFIESYRWLASGSDRMCPICEERDGQIFSKEDLPLDHPNGMCTFEVVMDMSYDEIGSKLADWVNGEGDSKLNSEIDNFARDLYDRGKVNIDLMPKSLLVNENAKQMVNRP